MTESSFLNILTNSERETITAFAQRRTFAAGEMLFREGDPADTLYVPLSGKCMVSREAVPIGEARLDQPLDLHASLGGLAHIVTAIATSGCEMLCWNLDELWRYEPFAKAARQYLASTLVDSEARLAELEAPVHFQPNVVRTNNPIGGAELTPGPFLFDRVTMLIALCDADLESVQALVPEGLALLRRPGLARGPVFLAFAQFPKAYPESDPYVVFSYDETTCFIPVRHGSSIGLFVPYIYPSAYEPILLGREIYGFPKRLGKTVFLNHQDTKPKPSAVSSQQSENLVTGRGDLIGHLYEVTLTVDSHEHYHLSWDTTTPTRELRLVRALSDWLGIEGRLASAAFRAGDVLRQAMRLPAYRRIDVYNHKRILAPDATLDAPKYDVDRLTRATFGVLRWHHIAQVDSPQLAVASGPFLSANLGLREAYFTQLDMRLSIGQKV